jgi:hypothetical protein
MHRLGAHDFRAIDQELSRRHGDTDVRTLRKIYGLGFAKGFPDTTRLAYVLQVQPRQESLAALRRDHSVGLLGSRISRA